MQEVAGSIPAGSTNDLRATDCQFVAKDVANLSKQPLPGTALIYRGGSHARYQSTRVRRGAVSSPGADRRFRPPGPPVRGLACAGLTARHDADCGALVIEPAQSAKPVIPQDAELGMA